MRNCTRGTCPTTSQTEHFKLMPSTSHNIAKRSWGQEDIYCTCFEPNNCKFSVPPPWPFLLSTESKTIWSIFDQLPFLLRPSSAGAESGALRLTKRSGSKTRLQISFISQTMTEWAVWSSPLSVRISYRFDALSLWRPSSPAQFVQHVRC